MVHVKAPTGDHKIADGLEATKYHILSQLADQPVFRVQPVDADSDEGIHILHQNVLFPIQSATTTNDTTDGTTNDTTNDSNLALMKGNLWMNLYFED